MGVMDEKLWKVLEAKASEEDKELRPEQQVKALYLTAVQEISMFGVDRAKTIRDTFPMYTLHDETHICNVLRIMADLLGASIDDLTRDEAAMLILAVCCHDIGMSYSDDEKQDILRDIDRLNQYLEHNHGEYVKAYTADPDNPCMTDEMLQKYLRSIHHERAAELLAGINWPTVLYGKVDRNDLVRVCQSHGESTSRLQDLQPTTTIDLRLCAVLLRLADILDFDTSRAPRAVYEYSGLELAEGSDAKISREEWQKHMASQGFDFCHAGNGSGQYELPYHATSHSMQIEQTVNCYLDWVDRELDACDKLLQKYTGKWSKFVLPSRIKRTIIAEGYLSGQYRLTMDQDQIMELLVGKDLYSDPSVFIRELIQNAIDAVRTREQLDKGRPRSWKPQINIRTWMDEAGYHWFRIEDNGTGMTEEIIKNYFLKIGRSYYTSDTFRKEKIRQGADPNYTPISRFGIGILSCFMGDESSNQVEVSTKHFGENRERPSALRLSMHGMNGYYYMASQKAAHCPGPMKGVTDIEKQPYLQQPGTVIAVRANLYQAGKYRGFKEIVDRYVVCPVVPIHYEGPDGVTDYMTESEFMDVIHKIRPAETLEEEGRFEFPLTAEQWAEVTNDVPELKSVTPPKLVLKCAALDHYTSSPYLSGALLTATVESTGNPITMTFGTRSIEVGVYTKVANEEQHQLCLDISLDFPSHFEDEMNLIGHHRGHLIEHISEDARRRLFDNFHGDALEEEILDALLLGHSNNPEWWRHMGKRWNISDKSLRQKLKAGKEVFQKITGQVLPGDAEYATYEKIICLKKTWKFTVCDLSKYSWYRKCFQKTYEQTTLRGLAAHNGVVCGNSGFFFSDKDSLRGLNLGTIILLKDKYRPSVDVARIGVRQLTLEAASDLALIQNSIVAEGFQVRPKEDCMLNIKLWSIPASAYCHLLDVRPDFLNRLLFHTNKGVLGVQKLAEVVEGEKTLKAEVPLRLSGHTNWHSRGLALCSQLCFAYLRKNYCLRADSAGLLSQFYAIEKRTPKADETGEFFSPTFFLPAENGYKYLTTKDPNFRYFCNVNHRFSQFILQNAKTLKERVPGIFTELIRVLSEEKGEQLISKANNALSCLQKLPGLPVKVPDDIFLVENDLY